MYVGSKNAFIMHGGTSLGKPVIDIPFASLDCNLIISYYLYLLTSQIKINFKHLYSVKGNKYCAFKMLVD